MLGLFIQTLSDKKSQKVEEHFESMNRTGRSVTYIWTVGAQTVNLSLFPGGRTDLSQQQQPPAPQSRTAG